MADSRPNLETGVRRSRRSTAGNRMEAALSEMATEAQTQHLDEEADTEFTVQHFEEDKFESDFESTDDEKDQEEDYSDAEQAIQQERMRERKIARDRLAKATVAAEKRQAVTFNLETPTSPTSSTSKIRVEKARRRVSLMNMQTEGLDDSGANQRIRQSQRSYTRNSGSILAERLKKQEESKASQRPKRSRRQPRSYTQAELIARALDNEEGNVKEHKDYLKNEEERRRRARVVRSGIQGPFIRWISKTEDEIIVEERDQHDPLPAHLNIASSSHSSGTSAQNLGGPSNYYVPAGDANSAMPSLRPPTLSHPQPHATLSVPVGSALPTPQRAERIEKVSNNYIIHDNRLEKKPTWSDTMTSVFGDHENWAQAKVYPAKSKIRPMGRPKEICPITGQLAPYRDPRTGVPYANIDAFKTLTSILNHEYVWNAEVGCYTAHDEPSSTPT